MAKNTAEMQNSQSGSGYVVVDGSGNGSSHSTPESHSPNTLTPEIWSMPNSKTATPHKKSGSASPPEIILPPTSSSGNVSPATPPDKLDVEIKTVTDKVNSDDLKAIREKHEEELKRQDATLTTQFNQRLAELQLQHVKDVQDAIAKITADLSRKHASELSSQKKLYEQQILEQEAKAKADISKRDAEVASEITLRLEAKAAMINEKILHEATQAALVSEQQDHAKTRSSLDYSQRIIASHAVSVDNAYKSGYSSGYQAAIASEKDRMNGPANM